MMVLTGLQDRLYRVLKTLVQKTQRKEVSWKHASLSGYEYHNGGSVVAISCSTPISEPDFIRLSLNVNGKKVSEILASDDESIFRELRGCYEIIEAHATGAIDALDSLEASLGIKPQSDTSDEDVPF